MIEFVSEKWACKKKQAFSDKRLYIYGKAYVNFINSYDDSLHIMWGDASNIRK